MPIDDLLGDRALMLRRLTGKSLGHASNPGVAQSVSSRLLFVSEPHCTER